MDKLTQDPVKLLEKGLAPCVKCGKLVLVDNPDDGWTAECAKCLKTKRN